MTEYLLKVSFVIGIALLFYKCVLQQESFFSTNRLYLIGCIVLAFALPFVSMPQVVSNQGFLSAVFQSGSQPEARATKLALEIAPQETYMKAESTGEPKSAVSALPQNTLVEVEERAEVQQGYGLNWRSDWLFLLGMLYGFGVVIFTLNLLVQACSILYKAIRSADKVDEGDFVIVNTENMQAPCSFFKYIFIYPDAYDFATYEQIIAHEKIHVRQGHTVDLLLAEIAVIFLWFNPLIWLYKKEVEKNIEYQTDAILLESEQVSKDHYQLSLLQIACPNKPLSITINYNQSLLKQRIIMMNAKKSNLHSYWKYTFLAPLFFGTILFMNEPAISQVIPQNDTASIPLPVPVPQPEPAPMPEPQPAPEPAPAPGIAEVVREALVNRDVVSEVIREVLPVVKRNGYSMNISGQQADMSEGYWYSNQEGGAYCLQFKGSRNSSTWNMSRCFDKGLFQKQGNDTFVMKKETGTLQLTGNLDAEVGQGKYTFTEDASFKKYLAENNITSNNENLMFHLFFGDVNKQYVSYLLKTYNELEEERLLELAIHGVSMTDYQNYMALFQKYSNKKPSIREVVEARIHGIDQAYVQEMLALGFEDLTLNKMMEAKIHGVNTAYVEGLRNAGFKNLQIDKIIGAKIHGVNPANIKEMQALGFGDLSLDKMMELKIHGVNAAYITDLRSAGFDKLSLDQVLEAKIHGLNAAAIKDIRALGFKDMSFREIISAKIHGVDAGYIEDLRNAGLQNLTISKTVEAKIHGIDGDFIRKARKDGYNLKTVGDAVKLKIHGMALESLKD
ncbi:M56 family metallopeptidase [Pontibacter pamirensis]|uniref:M56 family metallopeptidase n=1 Tax=Pontibacter pamirensis TaxID=2562824 RepID=UPI0013896F61|nr:M56 family metallopeptidase [Pontibacter pamirensis]